MPLVNPTDYAPANDMVLESQFAAGFKSRPRATFMPETLRLRLAMTRAQLYAFYWFERSTLRYVGKFDWIEFRDPAQGVATYSICNPRPTHRPRRTERLWDVDVTLRVWTPFDGALLLGDGEGDGLLSDDDGVTT